MVESRLAYRRLIAAGQTAAAAKKWWFFGDFRKAFAYMENWPITVTQSPAEQRGGVQPGHRGPLQGQRARGRGRHQSPLRREEHRRGSVEQKGLGIGD